MNSVASKSPIFFDGQPIAFVGGGNMASAMIGGLLRQGVPLEQMMAIEPYAPTRIKLQEQWQLVALSEPDSRLHSAAMVVWATKPQVLRQAINQTNSMLAPNALHVSIAAGIGSCTLQRWIGSEWIVRAMPNTPALIGAGMTGLFALPQVEVHHKKWVNELVATLGQAIWVSDEADMDAITALSGSGPAYVFMFANALLTAGVQMGLDHSVARQLVLATFAGATQLATQSTDSLETLIAQVTSKGGTTFAALQAMEQLGVTQGIGAGARAARDRAIALGLEIDRDEV